MLQLEIGRRYGFIDTGGTAYWGTVDACNQAGVTLWGVLFSLAAEPEKLHWAPGDRTAELAWRNVVDVRDFFQ